MQRRRRTLKRIAWFLVGFAPAYFLGCYVLACGYLRPFRRVAHKPKDLVRVAIPDIGSARNPAWCSTRLAAGAPGRVVFVFAHGHGAGLDTFAPLMVALQKRGYESIEPSMPGQDDSPEKEVGFGRKESDAMVRAAVWVRAKSPTAKIVYAGISMGGAAAWFAADKDPFAAGVITEGAYSNLDEALHSFFAHAAPGADIYLRPVVWIASSMAGLNPNEIRPVDAAARWKGRPALVIQGQDDDTIPMVHANRLREASGADLWVVPHAGHAHCYSTLPADYVERFVAFAKRLQ